MSNPIRPFDWWMLGIEATVLLIAVYGFIVTITHQIQRRARNKKLRRIAARLRSLIASGEKTKGAIPDYGDHYDSEWVNSANSWIADVEKYLTSHSSERALIEFRRVTNLDNQQRKHIDKSGQIAWISGPMGDVFQQLNLKLDNLQRIMLRSEDYF